MAEPVPRKLKRVRQSQGVKRFHSVEDDFVVKRSPIKRVRMADDGGMDWHPGAGVEQSFQLANGAVEKKERMELGAWAQKMGYKRNPPSGQSAQAGRRMPSGSCP